jgi:GAF domain-containing protein
MAALDDPRRLAAFAAPLLDGTDDSVLQECVERAAGRARAPVALVSFVMKSVQFFRAAVGLPPELEATRAASLGDLACQFVVQTEAPFVVKDARLDLRVPRQMVDIYGITAYAGVPVRVGRHAVGALCVADSRPRTWCSDLVGDLLAIARDVSERLETLAKLDESADFTIAPLRGLAARSALLAQVVRRSLVEIGPAVRLVGGSSEVLSPEAMERARRGLRATADSYDEVVVAVAELCALARRLELSMARTGASAPHRS